MIPPICEPILAGVFVSLFNKYILNKCNASCCETTHETAHETDREEDSSTTTSINSDMHVHIHQNFLDIYNIIQR